MSLERKFHDHYRTGSNIKAIIADSAVTLTPQERVVRIDLSAVTTPSDFTITLPPVIECAGLFFSFYVVDANSIANLYVNNAEGDSLDWDGGDNGYNLDANGDALLLYSDGQIWWVVENRIAT